MEKQYPCFEWDLNKARTNQQKHGIDFITAAYVFSDPLNITIHDIGHSVEETRWITLGMVQNKVLVVIFTYPEDPSENIIRIISARLATSRETEYYRYGGCYEN